MEFRPVKAEPPALNVAPLIDMVLLLLIFFAISSSFVVQSGVKVELPESSSTRREQRKELSVLITADGNLYFGSARTTFQELPELIRVALAQESGPALLVIKADQNVLHKTVVQVMDIARLNGVARLAIATRARTD